MTTRQRCHRPRGCCGLIILSLLLLIVVSGVSQAATIAGGSRHTVVITPDGTVWTWGGNGNGQLGDGTLSDHRVPAAVPTISDAVAVAAGSLHTLILRSDGSVWAWGYNAYGQLGDGTTTQRSSPIPVSGLTGVVAIAAGDYHSVALTSDGKVWTWGRNTNGQLGDGTTSGALQPLVLTSPTSVVAIAAGSAHTLAVRSDGTAWAWGSNSTGQLGDASTTQRTAPVQMSGVTGAAVVAAGQAHSIILQSTGTVLAVGSNTSGQLGDATFTQRTTAVSVSALTGITSIAASALSTYALKADGTVWSWGANSSGRLGNGTTTSRNTPGQVSNVSGAALVGAGAEHGVAVTTAGIVWTWGGNTYGQLGDGTTASRPSPIAISEASYVWKVATPTFNVPDGTYTVEKTVTIACVTPGAIIHYTLTGEDPTESDPAVSSGGTVQVDQTSTLKARAWYTGMPAGNYAVGQYTLAVANLSVSPGATTYSAPQSVSLSTTSPGVTIRYTTDGSTPTSTSAPYSGPISIGTTTTLRAVGFRASWTSSPVAGGTYTMNFGTLSPPVLDPASDTYTSGTTVSITAFAAATIRYTINGSAVTASSPIYTEPLSIAATTTVKAKAFHPDYTTSSEAAATYTIVVASPTLSLTSGVYPAGQVIAVTTTTPGATLRYTLTGVTPTASDPVVPESGLIVGDFTLKVAAWKTGCSTSAVVTATYETPDPLTAPRVVGGDGHSLAIRDDGVFWGWGSNGSGQVGDGTTALRTLPVIVSGLSGSVALAAGDRHSLAVRVDGSLWTWGYNGNGQLGDGTTTSRSQPGLISTLTDVVAVDAGYAHSLALREDGTVWTWGLNGSGQLGDGTTTQRTVPVQVSSLSGITLVTAAAYHSLALKSDGTIWSWGNNANGQLGSGNTTGRSTPGQVLTLTTAIAVCAGGSHALALLSDGTVYAWGSNASGQLGDGTITQRTSPVWIDTLSDVTAIASGGSHSLALSSDGAVWAWGSNANGQLGDGTTTSRTTPVQVSGLPVIVFIAAGTNHSLAVAADGSIWAWGRNAEAQLGDGSVTIRTLPVQIAMAGMVWKVAAPVLSLASGIYTATQTVTVTEADSDAIIHYTTTGASPSQTDPVIASGGTVSVLQSLTLRARAWKPGAVSSEEASAAYELKVLPPSFSPASGFYAVPQSVVIATPTPGATLTYTSDGTEPAATSTVYSGAIPVSSAGTLKARAFKTGWTPSSSVAESYVLYSTTVATPTISPATGAFVNTPLITLSTTTVGATIRYTLDGSDPTAGSFRYDFPFLVDRSVVLKAQAFLAGASPSAVATATYALDAAGATAVPAIVPAGGLFATRQAAVMSGPAGAVLRYTTSGGDPAETDTALPAGGSITVDRALVLKVRAWSSGSLPSAVRRADFVITGTVAAGQWHTLALAADGTVWAWGAGTQGQLGNGTNTPTQETPVSVSSMTDAIAIAAGDSHSLAVRSDGTVWAWGGNNAGQLGDGTTSNRNAPVQVSGLTSVVAVAAGALHSLALKSDGTVWAWGQNSSGELGDGSTANRLAPVQVLGLRGITGIAAGGSFSLALQQDGADGGFVWAFGRNDVGQLGEGSNLSRAVPVRVIGVTSAVEIDAGGAFGLARLHDGRVIAWGSNDAGQLGAFAPPYSTTPVAVPTLAHIRRIGAGQLHALAADDEGRVWGWGSNADSQLGTPNNWPSVAVGAPRLVPNSLGIVRVSAGLNQSVLLRADGSLWSAGSWAATGLGTGTYDTVAQVPNFSLVSNAWLLADPDADGVPSWQEYLAGLDPLNADSNENGLSDLVDFRRRSQVANPDDDGDGVPNSSELAQGTDPFVADTDADGVSDLFDDYPLDPTRTQKPASNPADTIPPTIILLQPTSARPVGGGGL